MSKRKILAACKRKGFTPDEVRYEWTPTPGENVPCYVVVLSEECADRYGEDAMNIFDDATQVLEWVDGMEIYQDTQP